MYRYEFQLQISPEQYLDYYRGIAREVIVRCSTGQTVQFPASLLLRLVTKKGIHGNFVLTCDERHKGASLERLNAPNSPERSA